MLRALCLTLFVLLLSACGADVEEAKKTLTDSIPIKDELEFRNMDTFPGNVVCGEFNAYSSYVRAKDGFKPFFTIDGKLNKTPTENDVKIFCSKDPSAQLLALYGVGPFDADNTALAKVTRDFSALVPALEAYYKDNYYYPTEAQGLQALVTPTTVGRRPLSFPGGGYINPLPVDPWGHPYEYTAEQWGGSKGTYHLISLGADGARGGTGENADIDSEVLPYLQHIAHLLGQR